MQNNIDKSCSACMEWQEHCYWSHMADEEKHFFKLAAGDFTESISVPSRFAKSFNGHISEAVTLKSPGSGKTWEIGVVVGGDHEQVVFQSGWKEFVSANSVEEGDCLLFRYTGASAFDVLIFDSSGCEKTSSPHFSNNRWCGRVGGSSTGIEEEHGVCRRFSAGTPAEREPERDDDSEEEEDVEVDEDDEVPAKTGYYFCRSSPATEFRLTEEDRAEISSIRVPVQWTNPVFVQVMHPGHVSGKTSSLVGLSSEFASKYLGTLRREVILRRASGEGAWHARYGYTRFTRGLYGHGWCSFVEDNDVVEHDVCLFEVMQGTRRPTVTVHVLRKVRGRFVLLH